jgi:demethylmenaquinone methyltransferase/2-methoxy-6-polyprenyl-1,4-benzoquinol methylase
MVKPYNESDSKKEQVALMFNNIAHRYDFLNHFLSAGIDKCWRQKAIREVGTVNPAKILDIATGTGDLTFAAIKLRPKEIVGIDISENMLDIARKKLQKKNCTIDIRFEKGDSENILYPDCTFNAAMVAFGVRNFENISTGLAEINRVLTNGGKCVILEFSKPQNLIFKTLYHFYFFKIVPFFGKFFSKDTRAYNYLPESVGTFPDGKQFLNLMAQAGFTDLKYKTLTFGIATLYSGVKKNLQ